MMLVFLHHGRLREWRLASGLRLEEVAVRVGCSYTYLRMIEDGDRPNPGALLLAKICATYGHSIGELFAPDAAAESAA